MAKLTLSDLSNLNNQTSAVNTINNNSAAIETAMEKTLSRDGTSPNEMNAVLDMNSNRIINLPAPISAGEPARYGELEELTGIVEDIQASVELINESVDIAVESADRAEGAIERITQFDNSLWQDNVAQLLTNTSFTYTTDTEYTVAPGDYIRTKEEMFSYVVAASSATDYHVITAGGVKLYVKKTSTGTYNILAFGAVGDGSTDDTEIISVAATLVGHHIFPKTYIFRITEEVVWPAGCTLGGGGTIFVDQDPYIRAFRIGSLGLVEDLTFRGTGVPTARATLVGGQYGLAIASFGTAIVKVKNCKFYDFVSESLNTGAALVMFSNGHGFSVKDCYIDSSCDGFSDFDATYTTGDVFIQHNISYSNSDFFFGCATVGSTTKIGDTDVSIVSHHIVTDNISVKLRWGRPAEGRALGRHGIAAHYDIGESYLIAKGNLFGNLSRHGIYLRGPSSVVTNPTGPNQIIGNIFRYCGQGEGSDYSSSIRVETTLPTTISLNLSEKAGYLPDGTEGTSPAYDIECVRGTKNLIILGNQLLDSKDGAILLSITVSDRTLAHQLIQSNKIRNHAFAVGLSSGASTGLLAHVKITNNDIELTGAAGVGGRAAGLWLESISISNDIAFSFDFNDNTITGQGKTEGQYAVLLPLGAGSPFVNTSTIDQNTFYNVEEGVSNWRYLTNAESYAGHRVVGTSVRITRNKFVSVGSAYRFARASSSMLAMVGSDNIYEDVDGGLPTTSLSSVLPMEGNLTGIDASGNRTVTVKASAEPSSQQWYVGDKVLFTPVAGGSEGSVCVTAGTPGTWKTFGTIAA